MKLTDMLSSEHRVIEQVVAALDAAAARLDAGERMRPGFFEDATRFIAEFSDGCHHAKEEQVLFPALGRQGLPTDTGPVAVMLHEHDEGRRLTAGLREAAARMAAHQAGAADVTADYARAYASLLAQHIFKEDNILFPLALRVIPAADWEAIAEEAERVDRAQAAGGHAPYLALARKLCEDAGVDPDSLPPRVGGLPCHAR
ncbi:MAG: hemerythrin domain-containing protein [Burkholderiales bacterium]